MCLEECKYEDLPTAAACVRTCKHDVVLSLWTWRLMEKSRQRQSQAQQLPYVLNGRISAGLKRLHRELRGCGWPLWLDEKAKAGREETLALLPTIRVVAIGDVNIDRPADARVRLTWVAFYRVVEPPDGTVVSEMNSLRP